MRGEPRAAISVDPCGGTGNPAPTDYSRSL